jgi:hypothetical protein
VQRLTVISCGCTSSVAQGFVAKLFGVPAALRAGVAPCPLQPVTVDDGAAVTADHGLCGAELGGVSRLKREGSDEALELRRGSGAIRQEVDADHARALQWTCGQSSRH